MATVFDCDAVEKSLCKTGPEARQYCRDVIDQARYEYGNGGYTGTFAEARGVELLSKTFPDIAAARAWLNEHCEKFGPLVIVATETHWVYGANCSA